MKQFALMLSALALFAVQGCGNEQDQYSGLSDLVAERQEVRENISKETAQKKRLETYGSEKDKREDPSARGEKTLISTQIIYEKEIEILDAGSGLPMTKGIAYMNREGQIVKIKIIRN